MEDLQGGTLALEHRYDVVQRAGRYGLVTVYRGEQDPFAKTVWIKAYDGLSGVGAELALFDRLKQSAKIASQLDGPGVLRVIDYGELAGRVPFVICERVDAQPLTDVLDAEGTLTPEATCALIARLADILEPAHRAGIPHGSVSPRWIFVPDGRFQAASLGHFQLAVTVAEILQTDDVVMSCEAVAAFPPEMFAGADVDEAPASARFSVAGDVWALGVIAYTCLVGVHPFFEDELDASDGILKLRNDEARPLDELGIDPEISAVVARALHKDPDARFASVTALSHALAEAAGLEARPAAPATPAEPAPSDAPRATPVEADASADSQRAAPPREREPGPSDRLLTVAIVVLILSNLAWLFYVTNGQSGAHREGRANKSAPSSVVSDGR